MRSCLYECTVMHHRLEPKRHYFAYRIFMFALDLAELEEIERENPLVGRNRWAPYEFRDRDHLTLPDLPEEAPLAQHITTWIERQGVALPAGGRILLVTLPRVFGYIFNPVSFYFCTDAEGRPVCAVAEVGNTFHEKKPYLLTECRDGCFRLLTPKHFYVSPFSSLELAFDFKLRVPGERLDIHIDDRAGERTVLLSALTGRSTPLSVGRLAWLTLKYPAITLQVIFLIHWHALLLWLQKIPWYEKTDRADLQRDVYNPHPSIAAHRP